jgi:hypothetical protein
MERSAPRVANRSRSDETGSAPIASTASCEWLPRHSNAQRRARRSLPKNGARLKGAAVAVFATARKLAQLLYRMLRYGQDYTDIGETAYELQSRARRLAGIMSAAKSLGYSLVSVEEEIRAES